MRTTRQRYPIHVVEMVVISINQHQGFGSRRVAVNHLPNLFLPNSGSLARVMSRSAQTMSRGFLILIQLVRRPNGFPKTLNRLSLAVFWWAFVVSIFSFLYVHLHLLSVFCCCVFSRCVESRHSQAIVSSRGNWICQPLRQWKSLGLHIRNTAIKKAMRYSYFSFLSWWFWLNYKHDLVVLPGIRNLLVGLLATW